MPVLLTTQDIHAQRLCRDFMPWLLQDVPKLGEMEERFPGCLAALRIMMEEYTLCRRLEIHDLPSGVLIHIVRRAIEEAQLILHKQGLIKETEKRFQQSWGIRVVFDDFSILKNTYIEIRDEPLLVRFLIFYLRREGVTTLLIDTQSGRPDTTIASQLESELRSLVDHRIYTWRFPFLGENRVAISIIPPISSHATAVTRELRMVADGYPATVLVPLVVDPHLEFYSGIETGQPQPIPLEIRLLEESPAFAEYVAQENLRYGELFAPLAKNGGGDDEKVIISVPAEEYDQFRDFCYLQRDTRLDHTLILQVDEFWMVRKRLVRRTSAFRPQWHYLNIALEEKTPVESEETTLEESDDATTDKALLLRRRALQLRRKAFLLKSGWSTDPYRMFEKVKSDKLEKAKISKVEEKDSTIQASRSCRADKFVWHGYKFYKNDELKEMELEDLKEKIDRVPFMWDFGFLLCRENPWVENETEKLAFWNNRNSDDPEDKKYKTVGDVWKSLPKAIPKRTDKKPKKRPSWRVFLEACYHVAKAQTYARSTPIPGFDLPVGLPQTLSCLILEIWASEIYKTKLRKDKKIKLMGGKPEAKSFLDSMQWRDLRPPQEDLIKWLEDHKRELFKTWLLLIEVLDLDEWTAAIKQGNLRNHNPNPLSVAARHWYKSACISTKDISYDEPVVPVGLPGYFSVRGDWFLTVAGGSRSERLANLALDMLNSRRANYTRLERGLGLPTRMILEEEQRSVWDGESDPRPELRTSLLVASKKKTVSKKKAASKKEDDVQANEKPGRVRHILYHELLNLGGPLYKKGEQGSDRPSFHWLWRSRLDYFHRHARICQEWVCRMILWWEYMRYVNRENWMNGFLRYDEVEAEEKKEEEGEKGRKSLYFTKKDLFESSKGKVDNRAWLKFEELCDTLADELKQATPTKQEVINTLPG